jgi:3-isopropylmalate dehydrogenase
MLEWLAERHGIAEAARAGALIRGAVDGAFAGGTLRTCELGGEAGTRDVTRAVLTALEDPALVDAIPEGPSPRLRERG